MVKRTGILLLVAALVSCILVFAGCESAAEIASEEAARASASAARASKESGRNSESFSTAAALPTNTVTLKSGSGTDEASSTATKEPLSTTQPAATATQISSARSQLDSDAVMNDSMQTNPLYTATPNQPTNTKSQPVIQTAASASADSAPLPTASISSTPSSADAGLASPEPTAPETDPYVKVTVATDFEILKRGSEGDHVAILQQYLVELGYMQPVTRSYFGSETEAAVKALQSRNSLIDDGIVGNSTWDLLLMSNARPAS